MAAYIFKQLRHKFMDVEDDFISTLIGHGFKDILLDIGVPETFIESFFMAPGRVRPMPRTPNAPLPRVTQRASPSPLPHPITAGRAEAERLLVDAR